MLLWPGASGRAISVNAVGALLIFLIPAGCGRSADRSPVEESVADVLSVPEPAVESSQVAVDSQCHPLVRKSIEEGLVSAENIESGKLFHLTLDNTELPPGRYRLQTIWETDDNARAHDGAEFRFREPEFTVLPDRKVTLATPIDLPVSWKFPTIPKVEAATTIWQGRVERSSNGESGESGKSASLAYRLEVSTGKQVEVDDRRCRWLNFKLTASYPAAGGQLTEVGHLLVDVDLWNSQQSLEVVRGWVSVTNRDIREELDLLHSKRNPRSESNPPERIVVPFDPLRDAVANRAAEFQVPLPDEALRLTDVINLLFGAEFEGGAGTFLSTRRLLAGPQIVYDRADRAIDTGNLTCLVVTSVPSDDDEPDDAQFELARNDTEVPFGLVSVEIRLADLVANLDLTRFSSDGEWVSIPLDEPALESELKALATLPSPPNFDLAALPDQDGARAEYLGEIAFGRQSKTAFRAAMTTLATVPMDGSVHRWLKLEIQSGRAGLGLRHRESAVVRVDQTSYELTGRMRIQEGWFLYEDADGSDICLPFDTKGDTTQTDDDLELLTRESRRSDDRLTVHDALALLFNAELLQSTSSFILLRQKVSGLLHRSTGRTMRRDENLKLRNEKRVAGKVWEFRGPDISYIFQRSHRVPFSFCSIFLEVGPIVLTADLDSPVDVVRAERQQVGDGAPVKTVEECRRLAEVTQQRLAALRAESPNIRAWILPGPADQAVQNRVLAEFVGEVKPERSTLNRRVCLRLLSGAEPDPLDFDLLSDDDRNWIDTGRYWRLKTQPQPVRGVFDPNTARKNVDPETVEIQLTESDKTITVDWDDLSSADQQWVRKAIQCWYR